MLGELTSELDPGEYITSFVSTAPKTYSYITSKHKCIIRLKGFSVNRQVKKTVNFPSLLQLINGPKGEYVTVDYPFNVVRNKRTMEVSCQELSKRLKVTYSKRVITSDRFETLPFGHEDVK